jgi:hypothetical protein
MLDLRRVASEWHDGQFSALYRLSSSGHYDIDTLIEVRRTYNKIPMDRRTHRDARELRTLYREILALLRAELL